MLLPFNYTPFFFLSFLLFLWGGGQGDICVTLRVYTKYRLSFSKILVVPIRCIICQSMEQYDPFFCASESEGDFYACFKKIKLLQVRTNDKRKICHLTPTLSHSGLSAENSDRKKIMIKK